VTDADLLAKKLAFIETCLGELRRLARPDAIEADVRERRFVEHTLQIAIQAVVDVASHIVADDRLGEPTTNAALFDLLVRAGIVPAQQASALRKIVGFRNVLVHGYADVDPAIVRDVLEHRLGDLDAFVATIRARIGE
jgi:uncharacterized protein YutE (UPF0331/DUF86 family)